MPFAALLAEKKILVRGFDIDEKKVDLISKGICPINEPGLQKLIKAAVSNGYLTASNTVSPANVFVIAVPTPVSEDGHPCLDYVMNASDTVSEVLKDGDLVIIESTCPVGTTEKILQRLKSIRSDLVFSEKNVEPSSGEVGVAYCPERILPGAALDELKNNDRIIGGVTKSSAHKAKEFYEKIVSGNCVVSDDKTAEMCKLVENAYRDLNIGFANQILKLSKKHSINAWNLIELANRHPRVNILQPGPGVGGHCIAVDPQFLIYDDPKNAMLSQEARKLNDSMPSFCLEEIKSTVINTGLEFEKAKIAIFGLTFKEDVEDVRTSPALQIAKKIDQEKYQGLYLVEPNLTNLPDDEFSSNATLISQEEAISKADFIVFLVKHNQFLSIKKSQLSGKAVIDFKNVVQQLN